jgi:uncharacterized alpha-E superfamily protein
MISRVADHCFWLGRYLERADSTARMLQVASSLALDAELTPLQCWQPVIIIAGEQGRFPELHGAEAMGQAEIVQRYLTFEERVPVSLLNSVGAARENARSIREVIPIEAWETVNELFLYLNSPVARTDFDESPDGFWRRVRRDVQLCAAIVQSSMLHDHPQYFISLGLQLERAGQTARIVDVHHHAFISTAELKDGATAVVQTSLWLSLLRTCHGFEAFMKSHRGSVTAQAVASFLIFEARFPHAVRHALARARGLVLDVHPPSLRGGLTLSHLAALEAHLVERMERNHLDSDAVHEILTRVVDEVHTICDLVQSEIINAAPPPRSLQSSQIQ